MQRSLPLAACGLLAALIPSAGAHAHIELDEPLVRHDNGGSVATEINKQPPCGLGGVNDVRNPARVTTFQAGETITVRWRETIAHSGRMRIAFSPSGDQQADFNANVLIDIPDPSGSAGNVGNGNVWEVDVTLPSTPCDNCTLQLVQVMNGNTVDPVADPTQFSTYYQCADLVLVGPGGGPDAGPGPGTDAGTGPEVDAGSDPVPDAGSDPAPDAGSDPAPDAGTEPEPDAGSDPAPDAGASDTDAGGDPAPVDAPDAGDDVDGGAGGGAASGGCEGCGSTGGAEAAMLFGLASLLRLRRRRRA